MLTPLRKRPDVLATGIAKKDSAVLNLITGQVGDLRVYVSPDGKKRYLRVLEGEAEKARWYEITAAEGDPSTTR